MSGHSLQMIHQILKLFPVVLDPLPHSRRDLVDQSCHSHLSANLDRNQHHSFIWILQKALAFSTRGTPKPVPVLQTSHSRSTDLAGPAGRPSSSQGEQFQRPSNVGDDWSHSQNTPALISSSKRARTGQAVLWMHVRKPSANAYLMSLWTHLLQSFALLSTVFEEVKHHQHWNQVTGVILDSFAASTLKKYLTCLTKFRQTCAEMRINLAEISAIHILDILLMRSKDSGMHGSMLLKSLRWFRIQAGISSLSCLDHPLLAAWSRTKNQTDRRESLPLPLYVLVQWEDVSFKPQLHLWKRFS